MSDQEFLSAFEDLSLPFEQWTHRAHIRMAFLYLRKMPFERAMPIVRERIKAYNAFNKRPDGPMEGYNETTTRALLHIIAAVMSAYGQVFPCPTGDAFCDTHPQLMSKHILRFFYSPARRIDPRAKFEFVEPDLAPLPKIMK